MRANLDNFIQLQNTQNNKFSELSVFNSLSSISMLIRKLFRNQDIDKLTHDEIRQQLDKAIEEDVEERLLRNPIINIDVVRDKIRRITYSNPAVRELLEKDEDDWSY
jgi:hypothetical protein